MSDKNDKSLDILGVKPIGDAVSTVIKGTVEGAAAFLSRICLPAAEEFGLLLRDKVSNWRTQNLIKMTEKAERKLKASPDFENKHAHPRIISLTLEHSSWADSDEVQEMWAGLLASSCTEDGKDESNLMFINLLSQLTASQVRVLNYSCENAKKFASSHGFVQAELLHVTLEELQKISGVMDVHRLDRELDHLRALDLILQGLDFNSATAYTTPSALALHLYVRGQGSLESPGEYFSLTPEQAE